MLNTLRDKLMVGCLLITALFALGGGVAIFTTAKITQSTSRFVEDYWETADLIREVRLSVEQLSNTVLAPPKGLDLPVFAATSRQRLAALEQSLSIATLSATDIRETVELLRQLAGSFEEPVRLRDAPAAALAAVRGTADRLWLAVDPLGSSSLRTAVRRSARACSEVVLRHDPKLRGVFLGQLDLLVSRISEPALRQLVEEYRQQGLALFAADERLGASRQLYNRQAAELDAKLAYLGKQFREEVLRPEAASVQSLVQRADAALLAAVGASVLTALLLSLLLARHIGGPLARTVAMMEALGQGRLDRRLNLDRRDEIGRMAAAVDRFADTLQANNARTEELLEERSRAAKLYRYLFDSSPLPMFVYDRQTLSFLAANDAAVRHYGYVLDEFLSLRITDIRPPEDIPRLLQSVEKETVPESEESRWRHLTKDGRLIDVEVASHLLEFSGRPAKLVLVNDVTRRLEAERELVRSKERFERLSQEFGAVLKGIPDELSLVGPDMRIVWSNSPSVEGDGDEPPGLHQCSLGEAGCLVHRCFLTGEQQEGRETTSAGRAVDIRTFPLRRERGEVDGVVRWARDVTERVRLQQEADQVSRLAALGEIAAGVAHEINNPNGVILLNLGLLGDFYRDVEPLLEEIAIRQGELELAGLDFAVLREEIPVVLREMQRGAKKIKTIVEDLKNFARREPQRHEEKIDLNEVVMAATRLTANAISKAGARFELALEEGMPLVTGSFQRIEQVVINLLVNACQALPEPGRALRVSSRHDAGRQFGIIEVADEGRGIAAADLPHIFDPFFTTKRDEGGTGLGLSVSERIVREHGGRLEIVSRSGEGTTATLTLPSADDTEEE